MSPYRLQHAIRVWSCGSGLRSKDVAQGFLVLSFPRLNGHILLILRFRLRLMSVGIVDISIPFELFGSVVQVSVECVLQIEDNIS